MNMHQKKMLLKTINKSDAHNNISEQGDQNEEEIITLHVKPVNIEVELNFNS